MTFKRVPAFIVALTLLWVSGCASRQEEAPMSPAAAAADLKTQGPALSELNAAIAGAPAANPLLQRETGLAGVKLGATQEDARRVLGEPSRRETVSGGTWWEYIPEEARAGREQALRLWFAGDKADKPTLTHIQTWAPSRFETSSLVRVLDPAIRLTRKYGAPVKTLDWGRQGAQVWLYPAANVGYVVTRPLETGKNDQNRVVAGILVGLGAPAATVTPVAPSAMPAETPSETPSASPSPR
jgi:hypothetical protein